MTMIRTTTRKRMSKRGGSDVSGDRCFDRLIDDYEWREAADDYLLTMLSKVSVFLHNRCNEH